MGMPIVIPYGANKGVYQVKNVTPKATEQSIIADEGYMALSQVIVTGDADLVSSNIKKDVTIFGVPGTLEGGGDTENWPTFEPPIILAVPVGIIDVFLREAVAATSTVIES